MSENNKRVEQYVRELANEINSKNLNLVDENKIQAVMNIFKDTNDSYENIIVQINKMAKSYLENQIKEDDFEKHYDLNDFFDCRLSNHTLHIHVVPKSIKDDIRKVGLKEYYNYIEERLEDALNKVPNVLEENDDIKTVFAVSPLLRTSRAQEMFQKQGFKVEKATNPYFVKMFNCERIGQASISKEDFLAIRQTKNDNNKKNR